MPSADEHTERILSEAESLLAAGRPADAGLAFERVLLVHPAHEPARQGLARAQAAQAEQRRQLDACLEDARRLAAEGCWSEARLLLDRVEAEGGDRDGARALRDRFAPRGVPHLDPEEAAPAVPAVSRAPRRRRLRPRLRRSLAGAWAVLVLVAAAVVLARWDDVLAGLTARPTPRSPSVAHRPAYPPPTAGEQALEAARLRLEAGDPDGALLVLSRVTPEDPAFPFVGQLRSRADRARREAAP